VRRGEIWTVAGAGNYADKPRPVVILQEDSFDATSSITVCACTTHAADAAFARLLIEPSERNGLRARSYIMVDKIVTVPKSKLGQRLGVLNRSDVARLNRAVLVFLGLAASPREERDATG
jgi:mRNA interferase MazF